MKKAEREEKCSLKEMKRKRKTKEEKKELLKFTKKKKKKNCEKESKSTLGGGREMNYFTHGRNNKKKTLDIN